MDRLTGKPRNKSKSVYAARQINALLMGRKISNLLAHGFVVRDEENQQVAKVIVRVNDRGYKELAYKVAGAPNCTFMLFDADPNHDDGAHTTVHEFNKAFERWTAVHPSNVLKLTEA